MRTNKLIIIIFCLSLFIISCNSSIYPVEDYKKIIVVIWPMYNGQFLGNKLNGFIIKHTHNGRERLFLITAEHGIIKGGRPVPNALRIYSNGEYKIINNISGKIKTLINGELGEHVGRKSDICGIELTQNVQIQSLKDQFIDYKTLLQKEEKDVINDRNKEVLLMGYPMANENQDIALRSCNIIEGQFGEDIEVINNNIMDMHRRQFRGFRISDNFTPGDCGSLALYQVGRNKYKIIGIYVGLSMRGQSRDPRFQAIARSHRGTTHDSTVIAEVINEFYKVSQ